MGCDYSDRELHLEKECSWLLKYHYGEVGGFLVEHRGTCKILSKKKKTSVVHKVIFFGSQKKISIFFFTYQFLSWKFSVWKNLCKKRNWSWYCCIRSVFFVCMCVCVSIYLVIIQSMCAHVIYKYSVYRRNTIILIISTVEILHRILNL